MFKRRMDLPEIYLQLMSVLIYFIFLSYRLIV